MLPAASNPNIGEGQARSERLTGACPEKTRLESGLMRDSLTRTTPNLDKNQIGVAAGINVFPDSWIETPVEFLTEITTPQT
jgi:hypothetical protein